MPVWNYLISRSLSLRILFFAVAITVVISLFFVYRFFTQSIPLLTCNTDAGTSVFSHAGMKITSTAPGLGHAKSTYPGCDAPDIFLWDCTNEKLFTQTWSACNVGSTLAFTGGTSEPVSDISSSMGYYFSWGKNEGYSLIDHSEHPLQTSFLTRIRISLGWEESPSNEWNQDPRGPCKKGYRIPSQKEWETALSLQKNISIIEKLSLPNGGLVLEDGKNYNIENGYYWSSTEAFISEDAFAVSTGAEVGPTTLAYAANIIAPHGEVITKHPSQKNLQFRVRCIQDPQPTK